MAKEYYLHLPSVEDTCGASRIVPVSVSFIECSSTFVTTSTFTRITIRLSKNTNMKSVHSERLAPDTLPSAIFRRSNRTFFDSIPSFRPFNILRGTRYKKKLKQN